jgi:hypothetical protein
VSVTHCRIVRTEVAAIGLLWWEQPSSFIGLRSPDVGIVVRRISAGLVFFTIFMLLAVLVGTPDRDHGNGCRQGLGSR